MKYFLSILFFFIFLFLASSVSAQRGCCSYHGGIAYCDSSVGQYVCNDGEYSPTCGCWLDTNAPIQKAIRQAQWELAHPTTTPTPTPTATPTLTPTPSLTMVQSLSEYSATHTVSVGILGAIIILAIFILFRR